MGAQQSSPEDLEVVEDEDSPPAKGERCHLQVPSPCQATVLQNSQTPQRLSPPPVPQRPLSPFNRMGLSAPCADSAIGMSKECQHAFPQRSSLDLQRVSRPMGHHCPFHTRLPTVPHPRRRSLHLPASGHSSSSPLHRETSPFPGPFAFVCGVEEPEPAEDALESGERCRLGSDAEQPLPAPDATQRCKGLSPEHGREAEGCDIVTKEEVTSALCLASMGASEVQSSSSLEDLPPELLRRVLARVPRACWPAARGTSRAWRDLVCAPDMLRLRRREGLGESWAFLVEWMFRGSRDALALLWAMDPARSLPCAKPAQGANGQNGMAPRVSEGSSGAPGWYRMGCLPPMSGISHTSQVVAYGPYAVFLGGNVAVRTRGGTLTFTPGTAVWRHHLLTGRTRRLPDMQQGRVACATAVLDGKLVVAGGTGENDMPLRSVEQFDPKLGKWASLPDLRVARRRCFGAELSGRLWVFSFGAVSESLSRSAEVYDPETQKWTLIERMLPDTLGGRLSTRFAVVGGRLLLTNHVSTSTHDVMVYDEEKNVWCTVGQLPVAGFQGYGVVGLGDALYVEGGVEPIVVTDPAQLAAALCGQKSNFLRKAPYVNAFHPFEREGKQWEPRGANVEGIPRRCQQAIVSVL